MYKKSPARGRVKKKFSVFVSASQDDHSVCQNENNSHVAPNQVKDATDEDFENIFQRAAFFQTLLKNFLEVTRS